MSKQKRRKFSAEFKAKIVLSVLTGEKSQAEICRDHQLNAQRSATGNSNFWKMQDGHLRNQPAMGTASRLPNWNGWWDA